jgi:hypothetical protein
MTNVIRARADEHAETSGSGTAGDPPPRSTLEARKAPREELEMAHQTHPSYWHFARHYLEMTGAMLVGMLVLGAAVRGVLALAGVDGYTLERQPELVTLEMAADMAVGMAVWMRHRGHGWTSTLEMSGAMFAPAAVLIPLLWLTGMSTDVLMAIDHVAMFALMFLLMLRRRTEYAAH